MSVLDSAAAVARATAQIGQPDGAGACLANVYKWFGSVPSIGPGSGQYDWAIKAWDFSDRRHPNDYAPPAGVAVLYGPVGAPRWAGDRNYPCGDIGLSIGGGLAIFTDSPTGNTGVMSIGARGAQIGRPYLGWVEDFLGHETSAGVAYATPGTTPTVVVENIPALPPVFPEADMIFVKSNKSKRYYVIGETTVQTFISKAVATIYSRAVPHTGVLFQVRPSADVSTLVDHCRRRRDAANLPILSAIEDALKTEDKPEGDN